MNKNNERRFKKMEKAIEKKLNPYFDEEMVILVNKNKNETREQKIAEKENELGCKINRNKLLIVNIGGLNRI